MKTCSTPPYGVEGFGSQQAEGAKDNKDIRVSWGETWELQ